MNRTNFLKSGLTVSLLGAMAIGLYGCGTPPTNDSNLAAMDDVDHFVEEVATPAGLMDKMTGMGADLEASIEPNKNGVNVATIINTAKATWKFIEENEAVSNISYDYANALPEGASLGELNGFSNLQYRSYRLYGTNLFGMTVYDVTYTLVHQYGGSYDGVGQYLATVSVIPSSVDVLWGYTVDFNVKKVSVTNVGSASSPVASAVMELSFKVSTLIKKHTSTYAYQFRGDSAH